MSVYVCVCLSLCLSVWGVCVGLPVCVAYSPVVAVGSVYSSSQQ